MARQIMIRYHQLAGNVYVFTTLVDFEFNLGGAFEQEGSGGEGGGRGAGHFNTCSETVIIKCCCVELH